MTIMMVLELLGGLGMFIYGMHLMSDGLKIVAGNKMKHLLEVLTNNRFKAILVGIVVTIMVQSSSTTTVMLVGFVNAGLMALKQTACIMLGADIGTTVMAQLIAFKIDSIAPLFIAVGTCMALFARTKKTRDIGGIVLGFGVLFFGVSVMSSSMEPLKESEVFINWLTTYGKNPFLGLLIGTAITAVMQSSGATIGLLQALAISGIFAGVSGTDAIQICIPIMLGTNIGTCATAMLSSIGTSREAKNVAWLHLITKTIGAIWVLALLMILDAVLESNFIYNFFVSISGSMTLSTGEVIPNVARQIAMAHTFFNIANTIVMLPLINKLADFLERKFPGEPDDEKRIQLDERLLNNPAVAIGHIERELVHLGEMAKKNFNAAYSVYMTPDEKIQKKIQTREERIDEFEHAIMDYTVRLTNMNLSQDTNDRLAFILKSVHDIERIGDHSQNIAELAETKVAEKITFTDEAIAEIHTLMAFTAGLLENVVDLLRTEDRTLCGIIYQKEDEIDRMTKNYRDEHMRRMNQGDCSVYGGIVFLDLLTNVERVGDHASNIADEMLEMKNSKNINKIEEVIY